MAEYPYHNEPTHDQGTVDAAAGNAARTTSTSSSEGRLIVDAVDKIFLLEPKYLLGTLVETLKIKTLQIAGNSHMVSLPKL